MIRSRPVPPLTQSASFLPFAGRGIGVRWIGSRLGLSLASCLLTLSATAAHAQAAAPKADAVAAVAEASASKNGQPGPAWKDLPASDQSTLAPLASSWNAMPEVRKHKWLVIAKNFASLSADEQGKLRERMSQWAALSRQQRDQARLNYAEIKKLPAQQRAAQWEAYQALSDEEKRKFAQRATPRPTGLATVSLHNSAALPPLKSLPSRHAAIVARNKKSDAPAETAAPAAARDDAPQSADRTPYTDGPAD